VISFGLTNSALGRHSGERAVLEERQRIARELHDVAAHHMSVIAIQAEAAPYKSADAPPELVESFREIRASALTGLGELRRVLGVLRDGTSVQVDLTYRRGGLAVEVRNDARRRDTLVPAAVPRAAHDGDHAGGGHGIIGMRERTAMLNGRLDAGPTSDGGYLVSAFLPVSPDSPEGGR
jgi:signal transduction histidine kinase